MDTRGDLRTELEAMIAAGRELSPDTDRYLAEQFLNRLGATTARTKRRRRPPAREARGPGRTATALLIAALVAAVVLAIGTPISPHGNQNYAPAQSYQAISQPSSCSWHTQLMFFGSMKDLLAFEGQVIPKYFRFSRAHRTSDGKITVRAEHWRCL